MTVTKRLKSKTTVSFQVTFTLPEKMSINEARQKVRDAMRESELNIETDTDLKVHLTNKEVSYGQR